MKADTCLKMLQESNFKMKPKHVWKHL